MSIMSTHKKRKTGILTFFQTSSTPELNDISSACFKYSSEKRLDINDFTVFTVHKKTLSKTPN